MNEHAQENGFVDISSLKAGFMPLEDYREAHKGLPIVCHDAAILYNGGFLLVQRDNMPALGDMYVIGGRVLRGVPIIESLKQKVKEECGLEITDVKELGVARTFYMTDPFDHGKGTDNINFMFFAKGEKELKLDNLHSQPLILKPEDYPDLKVKLDPYTREILEKAMEAIG